MLAPSAAVAGDSRGRHVTIPSAGAAKLHAQSVPRLRTAGGFILVTVPVLVPGLHARPSQLGGADVRARGSHVHTVVTHPAEAASKVLCASSAMRHVITARGSEALRVDVASTAPCSLCFPAAVGVGQGLQPPPRANRRARGIALAATLIIGESAGVHG